MLIVCPDDPKWQLWVWMTYNSSCSSRRDIVLVMGLNDHQWQFWVLDGPKWYLQVRTTHSDSCWYRQPVAVVVGPDESISFPVNYSPKKGNIQKLLKEIPENYTNHSGKISAHLVIRLRETSCFHFQLQFPVSIFCHKFKLSIF